MRTNKKIVYVCHCIDTEGPLYESLEATFERLETSIGIKIKPSQENLIKIQNQEMDLGGKEKVASLIVDKNLINYNDTSDKLDNMLDEMMSETYRGKYADSFGNGLIYNWFILDHIGYKTNPRRRDIGYHNIYNNYTVKIDEHDSYQDEINWHFHPMSAYMEAHMCATSFINSPHLYESLARAVIDRCWFPSAFRAGFNTERPDSHWFLEQWIPFDFSNQAIELTELDIQQMDNSDGRFGDWRRARADWAPYNPSHDDYQAEGSCRRTIFRCLNIGTRIRLLNEDEVDKAFIRADCGTPTILAFTNHDFRDMRIDIENAHNLIMKTSKKYPDVRWCNSGAKSAARKVLNIGNGDGINLTTRFDHKKDSVKITVETDSDSFVPQPFLAIKTFDNKYMTDNFDFQIPRRKWTYTFDTNSINFKSVNKIGIATNDINGTTCVEVYDSTGEILQRRKL